MKTIINLGCGNRLLTAQPGEKVINHDRIKHRPEVAVVHDLDVLPWPWEDNSADVIVAMAVFEHLRIGLEQVMEECWRVLRPGGLLQGKMPVWDTPKAWSDPTHRRPITDTTMRYFDPDTKEGTAAQIYGMRPWKLLSQEPIAKGSSLYFKLQVRK